MDHILWTKVIGILDIDYRPEKHLSMFVTIECQLLSSNRHRVFLTVSTISDAVSDLISIFAPRMLGDETDHCTHEVEERRRETRDRVVLEYYALAGRQATKNTEVSSS